MIKTLKSKNIDWLIDTFVDDDLLLSMEPVIAGSFAVNIYKSCMLYDTDDRFNQFKNKLEKRISLSMPSLSVTGYMCGVSFEVAHDVGVGKRSLHVLPPSSDRLRTSSPLPCPLG